MKHLRMCYFFIFLFLNQNYTGRLITIYKLLSIQYKINGENNKQLMECDFLRLLIEQFLKIHEAIYGKQSM